MIFFFIGSGFTQYVIKVKESLPERVAELDVDTAVALPPVCTVHFNLELTVVSSTCCKSANGKNLKQAEKMKQV